MTTEDLFDEKISNDSLSDTQENRISNASLKLAVDFTLDNKLPKRYRRNPSQIKTTSAVNKLSNVEIQFKEHRRAWKTLIKAMLSKLDHNQAWRFIDLLPQIDANTSDLADCKDFCDFIDYFEKRRDAGDCDPDEIGSLALLSVALQGQIERYIHQHKSVV